MKISRRLGFSGMMSSVMSLLCKHVNLSLDPQHPCKKLSMVEPSVSLEVTRKKSVGSRVHKRPCLRKYNRIE